MSVYGKRRRGGRIGGVLVFLLAAVLMLMLSTTLLFNIKNVNVTGNSIYSVDTIISASGVKAGDNLVRTATDKIETKIENKLAYIEKAEIRRSFPDTLVIDVEACVPAANFLCDNYTLLISEGGKVLEQTDEPKAGLLNFTGTQPKEGLLPGDAFESEDEHKTGIITELMSYYSKSEEQKENVTLVDISDRSNICYTYDDRIVVNLGTVNDIGYKIDFSREIITKKIGDATEGVLTILSDAQRASFLDKDSIENNERIYKENMAALEEESEAEDEYEDNDAADSGEQTYSGDPNDPIME